MKKTLYDRIGNDLRESRLTWSVAFSFIPIMFFTYLFHESGHWMIGELLGNEMTISLNNSAPKSGYFLKDNELI